MAKYYIQSGEVEVIVTAADAEGAALWLINRTIRNQSDLQEFDFGEPLLDDEEFLSAVFAMDVLDSEILASEIGFGKSEAGVFQTDRLFSQWFGLVEAVNHLISQLGIDNTEIR